MRDAGSPRPLQGNVCALNVTLRPTSPLRADSHIEGGCCLWLNRGVSPKQHVAGAVPAVTTNPCAARRARVLGVWLTALACALTQLCALASQVRADCAGMGCATRSAGAAPQGVGGSWLGTTRRCHFPRLTLLEKGRRLQFSQGWSADDVESSLARLGAHFSSLAHLRARFSSLARLRARFDAVPTQAELASPDTVRTVVASAGSGYVASAILRGSGGNTAVSVRGPVLTVPRQNDSALADALRRRTIVANSFMLVGGGAISAGLIAAGLAYTANRAYGQKDPLERADAERASADLARIVRAGTVATSLLGAGGAALLSGLALKLWSRDTRGSDTRVEGKLTAKPHKLGGMLALQGSWGVAL